MMKIKPKHMFEGIIVILVLMIFLAVSMPLFLKGQKTAQIENSRKIAHMLRDMMVKNPDFQWVLFQHAKQIKEYSLATNRTLQGTELDFYVYYELAELDIGKLCKEFTEFPCSDEILQENKFFTLLAYQRENKKRGPFGIEFQTEPFYFSVFVSNDPAIGFKNEIFYFDMNNFFMIKANDDLSLHIPTNEMTLFDLSNGITSTGGFLYDSQEAIPLPTAMVVKH